MDYGIHRSIFLVKCRYQVQCYENIRTIYENNPHDHLDNLEIVDTSVYKNLRIHNRKSRNIIMHNHQQGT